MSFAHKIREKMVWIQFKVIFIFFIFQWNTFYPYLIMVLVGWDELFNYIKSRLYDIFYSLSWKKRVKRRSKIMKLEEIQSYQFICNPWTKSNLVRFLIQILLHWECLTNLFNLTKFYDVKRWLLDLLVSHRHLLRIYLPIFLWTRNCSPTPTPRFFHLPCHQISGRL